MNALQQLEQRLAAAIDAADAADFTADLAGELVQDQRLDDSARLSIYQNNVRMTCHNALTQIYPVCQAILGERCFRTLARDYVVAYPSRQPDLNLYGEMFHHVLQSVLSRPAFSGLDYLPELARFEWYWHVIYYAADDPVFDATAFAQQAAEAACHLSFVTSASLCLLDARFPILSLWRQHQPGKAVAVITSAAESLVLWRDGYRPRAEVVDTADFALLRALRAGHTLGQMAADGLPTDRLGDFIIRGWVVGHQRRDQHAVADSP